MFLLMLFVVMSVSFTFGHHQTDWLWLLKFSLSGFILGFWWFFLNWFLSEFNINFDFIN
jgi:hypothetical protein